MSQEVGKDQEKQEWDLGNSASPKGWKVLTDKMGIIRESQSKRQREKWVETVRKIDNTRESWMDNYWIMKNKLF